MSSIAVPSRTEATAPSEALVAFVRTALGAAVFIALIVTFTPFQADSDPLATNGNLVNQLGYGALGAVAILSHLLFTDRLVARSLLRPAWVLMALYLFYSVTQALLPDQTLRTALFTVMAMVAGTAVVSLPPDAHHFRISLAATALVVLGLSYMGVVLWPSVAIHQAIGDEPQHAGLWRGLYAHKNLAAPVMAGLFFSGVYLWRSGWRALGWIVAILSGLFVLKTGSKTSTALVPLVAFLVIGGRVVGGRLLPVAILLLAMVVMGLMTLGAVMSPALYDIQQTILPGTTFTGRMDLWRFALDTFAPRQWTGYGLESFWLTDNVFHTETPFELSWDPRGIVNGHSGYLDIAIAMGWPALGVAAFVLVLLPAADYVRCGPGTESRRLADLFLMILAFALLNSFLESYFFRRADAVWMLTWIAVVGLHFVGRFRIET